MTKLIFEVAGDVPYADLELAINDIIEKYEPLLKSGKLEIGDNGK